MNKNEEIKELKKVIEEKKKDVETINVFGLLVGVFMVVGILDTIIKRIEELKNEKG